MLCELMRGQVQGPYKIEGELCATTVHSDSADKRRVITSKFHHSWVSYILDSVVNIYMSMK
jgi:hypothetical protein